MSRRALLVLVLTFPAAFGLFVAGATGGPGPWAGEPTLISGTSRYDAGEWIHTDFVYDDYGADTIPGGQANVVSLAPTVGDFRYPAAAKYGSNAADIVEVRARVGSDPSDLEVRVLLQTIIDPSVVALSVDANGATSTITQQNSVVDAAANTVSFTLTGAGAGGSLTLNIGAGLHDGNGGLRAGIPGSGRAPVDDYTTGGPSANKLFDAAFNTHGLEGRGGAWNEDVQAKLLAAGDLAPFNQTIDLDLLRSGATTPVPVNSGYFVRLFESRQNLGEGMGSAFPQYLGKWQPYAVWVPSGYDDEVPRPLFLNMHSLSVHHNQYRGGPAPSASYKTLYEQYDAAIGAVVVTPLGRGPDGWYEDEALVDTLEVWADALKNYSIDTDSVFVGGYSMGGYGTYRLSTMMPDAFASAVSIVGPPASGIWAYPAPPTGGEANPDHTYPQLESLEHIPIWITHGAQDELVPVAGVMRQADRLAALGYETRFSLHPVGDHFAFAFQDKWNREAAWLASHSNRVTNPAHVNFKVRPASWATAGPKAATIKTHLQALTAQVGARLDGAYWVDDIVAAGIGDVTGHVNLWSDGIRPHQSGSRTITSPGTDGPSPYILQGRTKVWFSDDDPTDTLYGTLTGVSSLTVDVERAQLSDNPVVSVTSNIPATITFVRDGVVVNVVTVG